MEASESDLNRRRVLLDHIDWELRPRAWFYGQLDEAIDLAVAGRMDALTELDGRKYRVAEVIEDWHLANFVERIKDGEFERAGREEEERNRQAVRFVVERCSLDDMVRFTMANRIKVTASGQVSVPAAVRKRWGASYLTAEDRGDHLVLRPAPDDPVEAVFAIFAADAEGKPDSQWIRAGEREADAKVEGGKWVRN